MKLPPHAFQTYWDVHAWAGALAGVVLSVMFFAGVFALFHEEIAAWQDPRAHHVAGTRCEAVALEPLVASVIAEAGAGTVQSAQARVPDGTCAPIWIELRGESVDARRARIADAATGAVLDARSNVATFLFHMHFLYEPSTVGQAGMYVAGVLAVLLLLAIVTGVLIHLKVLVRQLHRFRAAQRARVVLSDLHKVLGVMGLPFQAMMALTGAMICLQGPLMMAWQGPVFDGDRAAALRAFYDLERAPPAHGRPGQRLPIDTLIARARAVRPDMEPESVRVNHPGDAGSTVDVQGHAPGMLFGYARVRLAASDGAVVHVSAPDSPRATRVATRWLYGLHYAWLGGPFMKIVYALLGLAGCATILTGNAIWLERRDPGRARRGNRILARLTLGGGLGVVVAVAAMLVANRVLPFDAAWHREGEVGALVVAWLVVGAASWRVHDERRAAAAILALGGVGLAIVPLLSALVTPQHLGAAVAEGEWGIASVDLGVLALGLVSLACAAAVRTLGARSSAPVAGLSPTGDLVDA